MHPYATDSDERRNILLGLAAVSIAATWGIFEFFRIIQFVPPWWLEAPSVVSLYALFYGFFDKWGWKISILRRIGIIKVPDISGDWRGYVTSSFDNNQNQITALMQIEQTWTKIKIHLETDNSLSHSQTSSIILQDLNTVFVTYDYINEPKSHAISTMHMHRGTARHKYQVVNGKETFNGDYYTGRDRGTIGTLNFER